MSSWIAVYILLIAMVSIQFGASIAKQLFPLVGAAGTTALRTSLAAIILCLIFRPWRGTLSRSDAGRVMAYGASLGVMNLFFYLALTRLPLGVTVAIEFLGPLTVAVMFSRRKLDFFWAGLAICGLTLLMPGVSFATNYDPIGIIFALGAASGWALYIVFGRQVSAHMASSRAAALGMVCAAIVTLPFGWIDQGSKLLKLSILPLALAVAVLSSALPYALEMISLRRLPAKTFGILMSLEPAIAALFGLFVLKEQLNIMQWLAIACVVAASVGSTLQIRERKNKSLT